MVNSLILLSFIFVSLFFFFYFFKRKKEEFVSFCAHELRSYLTLIQGYSEVLDDDSFSKEQKKSCCQKLQACSKSLHATLEALIQLEKGLIKKKKVLLKPFLEKIEKEFIQKYSSKQFTIENISSVREMYVYEDLFFLVIMNLLDNAVKHGKEPIFLEVGDKNKSLSFSVRDKGEGIEKKSFQGSGIGLILVKKILDHHRAKISLESKIGSPTTLSVNLPT